MKKFYKALYINKRFFKVLMIFIILFIVSFFFQRLLEYLFIGFSIFLILLIIDLVLLFRSGKGVVAERLVPDKFSNGDENHVHLKIQNRYHFTIHVELVDELPVQFQIRDFKLDKEIAAGQEVTINYTARPVERGEYHFGSLNVFVLSGLGLIRRKYVFDQNAMVPNYPSFLQMKKFELIAFSNRLKSYGLKKIRRIGQTMEFEQIKEYHLGDDVRNINWKSTAKRHSLMVNQFQDERSQPVYNIIDTGRSMKMPFDGLKLVDYAINATLILSSIILKKGDKAGMFSFSKKVENQVLAQKRSSQMNLIMETLYNLDTDFVESDFSRLYVDIKRKITQRSLLLLYTNFETLDALYRQKPYLQAIAKNHLLVIIIFENTSLMELTSKKANNDREIFIKTIAQKFTYEKKLIINELNRAGIQTILTKPQDLTLNTINKYLEIKARGQI